MADTSRAVQVTVRTSQGGCSYHSAQEPEVKDLPFRSCLARMSFCGLGCHVPELSQRLGAVAWAPNSTHSPSWVLGVVQSLTLLSQVLFLQTCMGAMKAACSAIAGYRKNSTTVCALVLTHFQQWVSLFSRVPGAGRSSPRPTEDVCSVGTLYSSSVPRES